jgi:hypothetical protein
MLLLLMLMMVVDVATGVCPRGDDPGTYGQHEEMQLLECKATGGTFAISFRQAVTPPLAWNASLPEFTAALNALPTIKDGVSVNFSYGNASCTAGGSNLITLQFFAVFGDLPAVQPNATLLIDDGNGGDLGSGTVQIATDGASLGGRRARNDNDWLHARNLP